MPQKMITVGGCTGSSTILASGGLAILNQPISSAPFNLSVNGLGQTFFDTTTRRLVSWDGTLWRPLFQAAPARLQIDQTFSLSTLTTVSAFDLVLVVDTSYYFKYVLVVSGSDVLTGITTALVFSTPPTMQRFSASATSSIDGGVQPLTNNGGTYTSPWFPAGNTPYLVTIEGMIRFSVDGAHPLATTSTLQVQVVASTSGKSVKVLRDSYGIATTMP
jgi:hypothetical protein